MSMTNTIFGRSARRRKPAPEPRRVAPAAAAASVPRPEPEPDAVDRADAAEIDLDAEIDARLEGLDAEQREKTLRGVLALYVREGGIDQQEMLDDLEAEVGALAGGGSREPAATASY